jgi:hypothetical protein
VVAGVDGLLFQPMVSRGGEVTGQRRFKGETKRGRRHIVSSSTWHWGSMDEGTRHGSGREGRRWRCWLEVGDDLGWAGLGLNRPGNLG